MLDIGQIPDIGLGHVAARQELRELVSGLALPDQVGAAAA
jgi:chromosome partitioning protein